MKRMAFVLVSMFSIAGVCAISPIQSFTPGEYTGSGSWLADDGSAGDSSSFLELRSNGWTGVLLRNGALHIGDSVLNIDANGFFDVQVRDLSDLSNIAVYNGNGNCGTSQCQMTVNLSNGVLFKHMYLDAASNSIYCFGAIYYNDGTPNVQWESTSNLIP